MPQPESLTCTYLGIHSTNGNSLKGFVFKSQGCPPAPHLSVFFCSLFLLQAGKLFYFNYYYEKAVEQQYLARARARARARCQLWIVMQLQLNPNLAGQTFKSWQLLSALPERWLLLMKPRPFAFAFVFTFMFMFTFMCAIQERGPRPRPDPDPPTTTRNNIHPITWLRMSSSARNRLAWLQARSVVRLGVCRF